VLADNSGTIHFCATNISGTTHYCARRVLVVHIFVLEGSSGTSHCGTSRLYVIIFSVEISVERVVMVRSVVVWVCGKSSYDTFL
jgi:hypothetical protein